MRQGNERFQDSFTISREIAARPGGTVYGLETRRMRSCNTADANDQVREGNHERSDLPQTWLTPNLCPQGETTAEGKQANEESGKTDCSPKTRAKEVLHQFGATLVGSSKLWNSG